jgi:3-deoxy-manno-octulosonate cytidylyltransferase (CMP-KDO synthetase)
MSEGFRVVIPARLGSTRLPGKVLRPIAGKPLVQHAFEAAWRSGADEVIIATDSERVTVACREFGGVVVMTSPLHTSGTDRINEVAQARCWPRDTIVVNLQGDEPLMPPPLIRESAALLEKDEDADIATLCHPLQSREEWLNPNFVKVVLERRGYALYFSRAPIPWQRDGVSRESPLPAGLAYRHLGLYAYRVGALARFSALPPSPLETCEALEQLRALEHGFRIRVGVTETQPPRGVDTEEDLAIVAALLGAQRANELS